MSQQQTQSHYPIGFIGAQSDDESGYPPNPKRAQVLYPPAQGQQAPSGMLPEPSRMYESGFDEAPKNVMGFDDASIRRGFIRKVYLILMVQILITVGIASAMAFTSFKKASAGILLPLVISSIIGVLVLSIVLACCDQVRRKSPMNYILLFLFTIFESIMIGFVAMFVDREALLMAVAATAIICLGLTLFAFQTKIDFTVCGAFLFVALLVFTIFGIIMIFWRGNTLRIVYAAIGVLLFSFYLVYDTQLMMGGNHKYSISPEEYIFAALNLYIDIIQIFLYLLEIFGRS